MSTLLSMVFASFLVFFATLVATEDPCPILSEAAAPVSSSPIQAQALDKTAAQGAGIRTAGGGSVSAIPIQPYHFQRQHRIGFRSGSG
jgi:hypothetical protein